MRSSDTIVVCRSDQLREASMVLACFAASAQPMLWVFDPPPCSEDEYKSLHESYRTMRDLRDQALGQRKSRLNKRGKADIREWSNEEIDRRVAVLTPFRRWVKRNRLLGELASGLPRLRRALFLFKATERDMAMFEPVPIGKLSDERKPFLPEGLETLFLLSAVGSGIAFTQEAWCLVHGDAIPLPAAAITVAPDSVSVIAGLHAALRAGIPLMIDDHVASTTASPVPKAATEAVVVEATATAASLVAVQYALRQGARLCVYQAPDISEIERCRQSVEDRGGSDPLALLQNLERAVAAVVPERIIDEVGGLPVTAYTLGVPYHFLPNWSNKPIGLITGDELLLTSIELYGQAMEDGPDFNILFDPGYFNPRETEGVLAELKSIPAYPLVLRESAASNTALIALAGAPIDLIYFNTHGSSTSLVLPDLVLPGYKLLHRVTFRNHPAIFNNSCQSWTGVGREFIEVGARCYLGTLWSVDASEAAKFAITVTGRIVGGTQPIAASMYDTGADSITERAYVYVGPVGACLRRYGDAAAGGNRKSRLATASALLHIAGGVTRSGPPTDSPMTWPVIRCLRENAHSLCEQLDRERPEPSLDRLNLISDRLDLGNKLRLDPSMAEYYTQLSMHGFKMMGELSWKTRDEWQAKARFQLASARLAHKLGQLEPPITLLRMTAAELEQAGICAGSIYIDLADFYREMRKYDHALESALRAQEAFAKPQDTSEERAEAVRGSMLACGRLAQLWRLANQPGKARAAAQCGYETAVRADDLKEQVCFKLDEARIHLVRKDFPAAVAAAEEAVEKSLRSRDDDLKVGAYGTLARAHIFAGNLKQARQNAIEGRNLALDRDLASQFVDFQMDLCDIEWKEGDLSSAMRYICEAGDCLAELGDVERIKHALNKVGQLTSKLDSWEASSNAVLLAAAMFPVLDAGDCSRLCTALLNRLIQQIRQGEKQWVRDGLLRIGSDIQTWITSRSDSKVAPQIQFIFDVVKAFNDYSHGEKEALDAMHGLDLISANGFHLASLLTEFGRST